MDIRREMNDSIPPRERLRELLAIPERNRTDAEWDEIASLEIQLAPVNRADPAAVLNQPLSAKRHPKERIRGPKPRK